MDPNTRAPYTSGFRSLAKFGDTMGWEFPYLGGACGEDLARILGWIDHLAVDKGHPASTVDSYVTGAKKQLLEQFVISEVLGRTLEPRYMLVVNAVRSVSESAARRVPYRAEWILEGHSDWPIPVDVAVVTMFMAALRQGELIADYAGMKGKHILKWENLKFLKKDERDGNREMDREEVGLVCADLVQFTFETR